MGVKFDGRAACSLKGHGWPSLTAYAFFEGSYNAVSTRGMVYEMSGVEVEVDRQPAHNKADRGEQQQYVSKWIGSRFGIHARGGLQVIKDPEFMRILYYRT
jgi:hypothetical protein